MASNSSVPVPLSDITRNHILYIITGSIVSIPNWITVFSIGYYTALRDIKHFTIIAGLALADAANQTAYVACGIYRIAIRLVGNATPLTPWQCMTKPHNLLWSWSEINASLMLVVVSCERLLAVKYPMQYRSWKAGVARGMVASSFLSTWAMAAVLLFLCYVHEPEEATLHPDCITTISVREVAPEMNWFFQNLPPAFGVLSVALYGLLWILYKKKQNQIGNAASNALDNQQRKVTKSVGISTGCTLFLSIIPIQLAYYFINRGYSALGNFMGVFSNANPFANMFIYSFRHKELQIAIKSMFRCKTMPDQMSNWNLQTQSSVRQLAPAPARTGPRAQTGAG